MNKYAFLTDQSCKGTEIAEGSGRVVAANAKQSEPRAYYDQIEVKVACKI
jgi:hypothetical protein